MRIAFIGFAALFLLAASPALAQAPDRSARVGAIQVEKVSVRELTRRLSQASGVTVVADRTIANALVTFRTPGGALEPVLATLVDALPKGSLVRRAALPPFRPGVAPDGDRIAAFLQAQADLVVPISGPTEPSKTDLVVMGKVVAPEKAPAIVASLDLRPVYLLTNPDAAGDVVFQANQMQNELLKRFASMTPEQQASVFDQQFDNMLNMDPALRRAMLQQSMQAATTMMQRIQKMSPDQQKQFLDEIRSALPPGFGAGAPGRPAPR